MKEYPRNNACPCGSGQKYKKCCIRKAFRYQIDESGSIHKVVPLRQEAIDILKEKEKEFEEKNGRPMGPGDKFFPDLNVEHLEHQMVMAMKKAGIDPAFIYAFEKTGGLFVTEENKDLISEKDMKAWKAAIHEFRTKQTEME